MSTEISISKVRRSAIIAYRANQPFMLEGPHGIGKSNVVEQVADELDIPLIVLDLSLLDPSDLLGMPYRKNGRTVYAPPSCLPQEGKGLLLFEELNRAPEMTRTPALELLTRRRMHDYVLPPGWVPCAAVNSFGGDYSVDPLDPAMLSRFLIFRVKADCEGWLAWARKNNVHPVVIEFVEQSPNIFSESNVNPRSMTYVSEYLKSYEKFRREDDDSSVLVYGWSGLVGLNIAVAMYRFYQGFEYAPGPKEILNNYLNVRAAVKKMVTNGKLDLVACTIDKLKRHLQRSHNWNSVTHTKGKHANLKHFLEDIPADMKLDFDKWSVERGYDKTEQAEQ